MDIKEQIALWDFTPHRRNLMQKIVENPFQIHEITNRLHFLCCHFPPNLLDKAFEWLVSNRLTGQKFKAWFKDECKNSDLEMQRLLLAVVNNAPLDRVIAGKNFKV